MSRGHIAIVGRKLNWSAFLAAAVRRMGYTITICDTIDQLLPYFEVHHPDLLILDDTFELVHSKLADMDIDVRFVVFATAPSIKGAIQAYRSGALDYAGQIVEEGHIVDVVSSAIEKPSLKAI